MPVHVVGKTTESFGLVLPTFAAPTKAWALLLSWTPTVVTTLAQVTGLGTMPDQGREGQARKASTVW